ncbi:MAG: energy-coupling factor transporter ATPase [Firmicutes bacterium]|nr:energy-coupling factor transporter ATPase [Bacillota bacterium]
MSIVINNLSHVYSRKSPWKKLALDAVSLTINEGEFFGVIGHTGSGKSTLIQHLNALIRIQTGEITIGDMRLSSKRLDFKTLRQTVSMVFQYPEYQLFAETVKADVAFGPKNLKLPKDEIERRVFEAIGLVGLDFNTIASRSPFELSGGQKRRVALAGVLAMRPKILVLDEPTSGLDPRGKKEILELILNIQKTMSPTIIMVSHNMDELAPLADRIAVMHEGKLATVSTPRELFSKRELLTQLNIDMPSVTRMANFLADNGWDICRGIVSEDELVKEIVSLKNEGGDPFDA